MFIKASSKAAKVAWYKGQNKNPLLLDKQKWVFILSDSIGSLVAFEANINDVNDNTSLGFKHLNGEEDVTGKFAQVGFTFFATINYYNLIRRIIHGAAV